MKANIFLSGTLAGTLARTETPQGFRHEFVYDKSYLSGPNAIPVSLTLPLRVDPFPSVELHHSFNGLIPEGWLLNFAIQTLGIERVDRFTLLRTLCRDNIGAIEVLPEGREPAVGEDLLRPVEVAASEEANPTKAMPVCMSCLTALPSTGHNGNFHEACSKKLFGTPRPPAPTFEEAYLQSYAEKAIRNKMSLAGVQPKFPGVFRLEGRNSIVLPGQFIFKPEPDNDEFRDLPLFELLGMALAARLQIPTAERGVVFSKAGRPVYVTRRFDRRPAKIHTEDMSQLLGRTYGDDKYSGSFETALKTLRQVCGAFGSVSSERFAKLSLFNYLLHNSDNHHKNHSVVILPPAVGEQAPRVALSPAYDLLPTSPFIRDQDQIALHLCGKKSNLKTADWENLFARAGLRSTHVVAFVQEFARQLPFVEASLNALGVEAKRKERYLKELKARASLFEGSSTSCFTSAVVQESPLQDKTTPRIEIGEETQRAQGNASPQGAARCAVPGCSEPRAKGRKKYCEKHEALSRPLPL